MSYTNYVFILGGVQTVILHPFDSGHVFGDSDPGSILGRYGAGEMPRSADAIRKELYAAMEKGARRHFLDKGYYVRLAITVAIFIVAYLFLSIVVRDPVPLIDELAVSTLSAAAFYFGSERKALSSPAHIEAVLKLRRSIDGAYFSESRVIDLVESWRDEAIALGPASFYRNEAAPVVLQADEVAEATALCRLLAARWKSRSIVSDIYVASTKGGVPGTLLDRLKRQLGAEESGLALAYLRLIPLTGVVA
ncbi:MAG TPA: hypothetical protein VMX33_07650 [bacterium]|nr:hypothetical protein [bacterium]